MPDFAVSDSAGPAVDSATPTAVPAARDKELSAATEAAMDGPEDETDVAQEVVLEEDVKSQHCVNLTHCQCAVASYNSGAGQRELSSLHIARRAGPPSLSTATSIPGDIVLVRCTSTEHKSEYRLERNIAKVFARFRSEGKATIRLKSPQLDVVVSNANPEELEKFLDTLFIVHTKPGTLPPLPGTAMLLLQPFTKEKLAFENQKKMKVGSDRDLFVPLVVRPCPEELCTHLARGGLQTGRLSAVSTVPKTQRARAPGDTSQGACASKTDGP